MIRRTRAAILSALTAVVSIAMIAAPAAHANPLSLLFEGCGGQPESQVFAPWGDYNEYTPVPGGNFESGLPWVLTGGAHAVSGNESYNVAGGTHSLSLPAGSSAYSPASCTSLAHPTVRFFARNTGAPTSRLDVEALYPGLLGGVAVADLGDITASSNWEPSATKQLLITNLLATLSLDQTVIAFRFVPVDKTGNWSIDDVYLDPFSRG
jgi:hypothetical protein